MVNMSLKTRTLPIRRFEGHINRRDIVLRAVASQREPTAGALFYASPDARHSAQRPSRGPAARAAFDVLRPRTPAGMNDGRRRRRAGAHPPIPAPTPAAHAFTLMSASRAIEPDRTSGQNARQRQARREACCVRQKEQHQRRRKVRQKEQRAAVTLRPIDATHMAKQEARHTAPRAASCHVRHAASRGRSVHGKQEVEK